MAGIYDAQSVREWCDQETVGKPFDQTVLNDSGRGCSHDNHA
jgi:hypothetical protein|nr:MAG TPA: hypothetical protein [Caudoviricetes sp.]